MLLFLNAKYPSEKDSKKIEKRCKSSMLYILNLENCSMILNVLLIGYTIFMLCFATEYSAHEKIYKTRIAEYDIWSAKVQI